MASLDQIVEVFSGTSLAHININSFGTGEAFEFAIDGDEIYCSVFLLQPFVYSQGTREGIEKIQFQMLVLDKPDVGEEQELELISKCKNTADDIIYYIQNFHKDVFMIDPDYTMTTVTEYSDNIDCGVLVDLTITTKKSLNRCDIEDLFIF